MKVSVESEVFEKFPQLQVGIVLVRNLKNYGTHPEILELIRDIEEYVKLTMGNKASSGAHVAVGRVKEEEHLQSMHSGLSRLVERIEQGHGVQPRNNLLNICLFSSLKHMVPIYAFDLEKAKGPFVFTESLTVLDKKIPVIYKGVMEASVEVSRKSKDAVIQIVGIRDIRVIIEEISLFVKTFFGQRTKSALLNKQQTSVEIR